MKRCCRPSRLLPGVHDEGVVDRHADDVVDAVRLERPASWLKRGTWVEEQVGVKAPGSEKTTTVLPLKMSSVVTSTQS
jgi:hypothetical protein